jgi:aminomethyltransferase
MEDRIPARQGYSIYANGELIGSVTSGVYSPNLDAFIGMASVAIEYSKEFTPLRIQIRDKLYRAKVTKFPFIKIDP